MKIYIVLKTVATNDGVVTKALRAFKSMRISAEVDRKALSDNIHVYNELFVK